MDGTRDQVAQGVGPAQLVVPLDVAPHDAGLVRLVLEPLDALVPRPRLDAVHGVRGATGQDQDAGVRSLGVVEVAAIIHVNVS